MSTVARVIVGGIIGGVAVSVIASSLLTWFGFSKEGVVGGSFAAIWMSAIGLVQAGSLFAVLQSLGAVGLGCVPFVTGFVFGGGIVFRSSR